ncbi:MAG: energy-coupled thiamine transporter ThiT [Oscillospiraceae bacterium]|nr:energy-coupled thiamine transporter ThiT [Oscillospiraceae bacterium]
MKKITARKLVESALFIAIATVLSMVKIDLPFGGGVTIVSMLPLVLCSHRWGWKWGVVTAFVYSAVQLLLGLDNVGYATGFAMVLGVIFLDYIIAYTFIGLSGIFGNDRRGVFVGILVTFLLRFLCHLITGAWIWGEWMPEEFMSLPMTNVWVYSFLYNGWYMLAEIVLTEIVAMLIYKPLGRYIRGEDLAAA